MHTYKSIEIMGLNYIRHTFRHVSRSTKYLKPLLHPIVHVYTRKYAANIVEKYELGLVVGLQRFALANNVNSLSLLEFHRTYCVHAEKMYMPIFIAGSVRP